MPEKVAERNRESQGSRRATLPRLPRRSQLDGQSHYPRKGINVNFDVRLRLFIYRYFIAKCRAPSIAEIMKGTGSSRKELHASLDRLCSTHAFVLQENSELWRAAPFSAVPTAFPVKVGNRSYCGNCIWDALGIPAMLAQDAQIDASCGCCNFEMILNVKEGRLQGPKGSIHIAVPARDWYKDIVFT